MLNNPRDGKNSDEFRPFSSDEFYPFPVYDPAPEGEQLFPPKEDEIDYYSVDNDFLL